MPAATGGGDREAARDTEAVTAWGEIFPLPNCWSSTVCQEEDRLRYIGSKTRVATHILDLVGAPAGGVFVDAMCGTGSVAVEAARRGWPVRVNDHLTCATILAGARLLNRADVPFDALGGYERALSLLRDAPSLEGFVCREYSPASKRAVGYERRYFTELNAAKIDGARQQIRRWRSDEIVTMVEERLLIGDLLLAASRVANIAGTYGCFLRDWSGTALRSLELNARPLAAISAPHEVLNGDVWDVPFAECDVAYFDPPYTKRQYAAYYHVLETIARADEPELVGLTGLRPWRDQASAFCYKTRALDAITSLVRDTASQRIFISYSTEGHVKMRDLEESLRELGAVTLHRIADIGRYRPNSAASAGASTVGEYVVHVDKPIGNERLQAVDDELVA